MLYHQLKGVLNRGLSRAARGAKEIRTGMIDLPAIADSARFYLTAYGHRRLFATLRRSGYCWIMLMIDLARDMASGGSGEYTYSPRHSWVRSNSLRVHIRRIPIPVPRPGDVPDDAIIHTHQPYDKFWNLRKRDMQTAVLVRNLFDQLESWLFLQGFDVDSQHDFLKSGYLREAIAFYNTWGEYLENNDDSRLFRYEEVVENPVEAVMELSDLWDLGLPRDCVEEASKRTTKEEMRKRMSEHEAHTNPRVSFRRNRGQVFSRESLEYIRHSIDRQLRYPLGYDY